MASASKPAKGFKVTCPMCGDRDETIWIDLNDLGTLACAACDEEYTVAAAVAKAAEQLARWRAVARWVAMAGEALASAE